jgi:hypothetical protein
MGGEERVPFQSCPRVEGLAASGAMRRSGLGRSAYSSCAPGSVSSMTSAIGGESAIDTARLGTGDPTCNRESLRPSTADPPTALCEGAHPSVVAQYECRIHVLA